MRRAALALTLLLAFGCAAKPPSDVSAAGTPGTAPPTSVADGTTAPVTTTTTEAVPAPTTAVDSSSTTTPATVLRATPTVAPQTVTVIVTVPPTTAAQPVTSVVQCPGGIPSVAFSNVDPIGMTVTNSATASVVITKLQFLLYGRNDKDQKVSTAGKYIDPLDPASNRTIAAGDSFFSPFLGTALTPVVVKSYARIEWKWTAAEFASCPAPQDPPLPTQCSSYTCMP